MRSWKLFSHLLFATALATASFASGTGENWPQWRGPDLNGASAAARNLPIEWSAEKNIRWKTRLPNWAASTPIVWGDTIFVTSAEEGFSASTGLLDRARATVLSALGMDDDLLLLALDRRDGSPRWQRVIGDGNVIQNKQNMASPSPVTDGRHVWTLTGTGYLTCFGFEGNQRWQRNIQEDYGDFGLGFGYGSSPLLHEGRLYIQVLHGRRTDDPSYLLAVDGLTGKTVWRVERPTDAVAESPDSYSTPVLANVEGQTQLIVSGGDYITGHDLADGKELWRGGGLNPSKAGNYRTIASALVVDGMAFAPSRRKPFIAFRLGGKGGVTASQRVWSTDYGPDVPTPTSDGERLYIIDDRGIALCLRVEDGSTVWDRQRIEPGTYSASPVLADGKIYAVNEEGTTTVLRAGDEFEILAVNHLEGHTLGSPAVSGEQIFLRSGEYLYCIQKTGSASD